MSQEGDDAADARLNDMLRMVGAKKLEPHVDRECQMLGHEFAYEPDEEPGQTPMHCIHCGAEDPDYPWHELDALGVRP